MIMIRALSMKAPDDAAVRTASIGLSTVPASSGTEAVQNPPPPGRLTSEAGTPFTVTTICGVKKDVLPSTVTMV